MVHKSRLKVQKPLFMGAETPVPRCRNPFLCPLEALIHQALRAPIKQQINITNK